MYETFCHGALKLDMSVLFTTFFLWTSLQFIWASVENKCVAGDLSFENIYTCYGNLLYFNNAVKFMKRKKFNLYTDKQHVVY